MNKLFTKVASAFVGMAMAIGVGFAIGSSNKAIAPVHATDTPVSFTTGSNTVAIKVNWNSAGAPASNNGVRMGTSKNAGSATFTIPSGTTAFGFYAVGWNGAATTASVSATVGTITTSTASLTSNSSAAGTINANATVSITETEANAKKEFTISNVTSSSTITLTTSGSNKRLIAWDAYYVAAEKTVSSISVKTAPATITYYAGEHFDPTGLELTVNYSDSTSATIDYATHSEDFTFSPTTSAALTQGTTSVTITYGGKSTTQAITVNAARVLSSISISGYTTAFDQGSVFAFGGTVTANYDNSTHADVTASATFSGYDMSTTGSQTVTVSYTESGVTKTATYGITVNVVTSVTFTYGVENSSTSTMSKNGVTLTIGVPGTDGTFDVNNNNAYKVYKGKTLEVSGGTRKIAQIDFTGVSSYAVSNFTVTAGGGALATNGNNGTWEGSSTSVTFNASNAQVRFTVINIVFESLEPSVSLAASSASSVNMLKGDSDTTIKVLVKNIESPIWAFTFDENASEGLSTSSFINVSAGALDGSGISTLTITTKAVGETTLHISASGTNCEDAVPVTINARPAVGTLVAKLDSVVVSSDVECMNGSYVQFTFEAEDTDGNPYAVNASALNESIVSGDSYGSVRGTTGVNGTGVGTVVARFSLKVLSSVYVDVTVNVVDDFKESVNEITFYNGLEAVQGEEVDTSDVFETKVANTHFGSTSEIADNEFLFSYENNRNSALAHDMFAYDFSHGTQLDSTHKSQVVYVFVTFNSEYSTSFTIVVEQADDPLTAIALTNAEINAGEVEIARGGSLQLTWALTPANPTDGRELLFSIDDSDDGVNVSVNSTGLISVAANSGLGSALILVEAAHNSSINTSVLVNVGMEAMSYQINEAVSWTKASSLSAGDRIVLLNEGAEKELTGITSNVGTATEYTENPSGSFVLTVGVGNAENSFTLSNGTSYLAYTKASGTTKNNNLFLINNPSTEDELNQVSWTIEFDNGNATITNVYNEERSLQFNSDRFCCYTSNQTAPQIYKMSGGLSNKNVDEALFNAVHNNFGEGKTYAWDASCSSFKSGNWASAGSAITGISGFANYKLNRAVANAGGNEIEQFLAKYDVVIGKFGTSYDFLGRFTEGGINYNANRGLSVIDNNTTATVALLMSVISVCALGAFVFLKRKKEN